MWRQAECWHPTSFYRQQPPNVVTGGCERPTRMSCTGARDRDRDNHCGPQARYLAPRRYPVWTWNAFSIGLGPVIVAGYGAFVLFISFRPRS